MELNKKETMYNKYYKKRLQEDPELRMKFKEYHLKYYKKRYNNDDDFKKKETEKSRERYNSNEDYRKKKNEKTRDRYYELKALKFFSTLFD